MQELIADARWVGPHGIGRFAKEVLKRIPHVELDIKTSATSPFDPLNSSVALWRKHNNTGYYFSPGYNPPMFCNQRYSFTLHDLIHLDVKEETSYLKKKYYDNLILPAVKKADRVFTVSNFSKEKILKWSNVRDDKVVVVGNGVDENFFDFHVPIALDMPYFLYIGNQKPHKNLKFLIEAFSKSVISKECYLAISGKLSENLKKLSIELGIYKNIYEIGYIEENKLPCWYAGAQALIMPSTYEGFGLPVIEAMASSALVLCSNSSCLPEIAGDHACYFSPYNSEELIEAFKFAFSNEANTLKKSGNLWARKFSWDNVATSISSAIFK